MLDLYKTYIDMREWHVELNIGAVKLDNTVINVNGYKVLLKTIATFDACKLFFIYDTKINTNEAFNETGDRYAEAAYEVIYKCRNDIEDELFNLFFKYKK